MEQIPRASGLDVPVLDSAAGASNTALDDRAVVERASSLLRLVRTIHLQTKQIAGFPCEGGALARRRRFAVVVLVAGVKFPIRRIANLETVFGAEVALPTGGFLCCGKKERRGEEKSEKA